MKTDKYPQLKIVTKKKSYQFLAKIQSVKRNYQRIQSYCGTLESNFVIKTTK